MRFIKKNAVLILLLSIPAIAVPSGAMSARSGSFINWACNESRKIDTRWDSITGDYSLDPLLPAVGASRRASSEAGYRNSQPGYLSSAGFIRTVRTGNDGVRLFRRTTRERSGPTRGNFSFTNPASMNHGLSNRFRRPRGTSAYRWNSSSRRGSVSRPRLTRFGRASSSSRRATVGTNISPFSGRIRRRR